MMTEGQSLEGQAASKIVEMLLSGLLDSAEQMNIDIHTDLGKMAQGKMDSISISSKDVMVQHELSVQELEVQTDSVSINPWSILFGKLELEEPINSVTRLVVTEADLNRTLSSDILRDKQIVIPLNIEGNTVRFKVIPPIQVRLLDEGRMAFSGSAEVFDSGREKRLHIEGTTHPRTEDHSVLMENFSFGEGEALSVEVMLALLKKVNQLIHSPFLHINGVAVQIQKLEVHRGSLAVLLRAQINQLPTG